MARHAMLGGNASLSRRMGSALGKTKVLAPSRHRGVDLLSERFIAFVLWEVKF